MLDFVEEAVQRFASLVNWPEPRVAPKEVFLVVTDGLPSAPEVPPAPPPPPPGRTVALRCDNPACGRLVHVGRAPRRPDPCRHCAVYAMERIESDGEDGPKTRRRLVEVRGWMQQVSG